MFSFVIISHNTKELQDLLNIAGFLSTQDSGKVHYCDCFDLYGKFKETGSVYKGAQHFLGQMQLIPLECHQFWLSPFHSSQHNGPDWTSLLSLLVILSCCSVVALSLGCFIHYRHIKIRENIDIFYFKIAAKGWTWKTVQRLQKEKKKTILFFLCLTPFCFVPTSHQEIKMIYHCLM